MTNFNLGEFYDLSWTMVVSEHQPAYSNYMHNSFFITISSAYGAFIDVSWAEKNAKRKTNLH